MTYTPWMAGYTEPVEAHNPALSAHGLAVWGWILRIVVALSFIVLPRVITTSTDLVDNQAAATNLQTFQLAQPYVPAAGNLHPKAAPSSVITSLSEMQPYGPGQALAALLQTYGTTHDVMAGYGGGARLAQAPGAGPAGLLAAGHRHRGRARTSRRPRSPRCSASSPQLATLLRVEQKMIPAQKASAASGSGGGGCASLGQLVFLVLVFFMRGRWSPRAAKADFDEHERLVADRAREAAGQGLPAELARYPALAPTGTEDGPLWVRPDTRSPDGGSGRFTSPRRGGEEGPMESASPVVIEGATIIEAFRANVRRIPDRTRRCAAARRWGGRP